LPGTRIAGNLVLEMAEHMLGAVRRPQGEQAMILVGEAAAAPDGHQTQVAFLAEDHRSSLDLLAHVDQALGQLTVGADAPRRVT
jgi:hypothetical protein